MAGALFVAAAVGATIGLLTAPAKGKDTRRKISGSADKMKNKFNDLVDELKCEYERFNEKVQDYSDKVKS